MLIRIIFLSRLYQFVVWRRQKRPEFGIKVIKVIETDDIEKKKSDALVGCVYTPTCKVTAFDHPPSQKMSIFDIFEFQNLSRGIIKALK